MRAKNKKKQFSGHWLYFIPHRWEDEKTSWEDVYLMPDIPGLRKSIWLTVNAIGGGKRKHELIRQFRERTRQKKRLNKKGFYLDDNDNLYVKNIKFTKRELLGWALIWLKEKGFCVTKLVRAPSARFTGSNQHALNIAIAMQRLNDIKKGKAKTVSWDKISKKIQKRKI